MTVFNPTAPPPPSHLSPRPIMSFSGQSVQRAIVSRKIKTRAYELANLIEQDIFSINLLELQPLNEYELYMRNFGLDNTSQVCNMSIHMSGYLSIHPFVQLYVHSFIHLSIHLSIHPFVHPYVHSFIHLSIHLSIHSFIRLVPRLVKIK